MFSGSAHIARIVALMTATVLAVATSARAADEPAHVLTGGVEHGVYTGGYGHGDGQFASYEWALAPRWRGRVDAGHDTRFGDAGVWGGLGLTRRFTEGSLASLAISSGTGAFIHPNYRIDLSGLVTLPARWLQATAAYTHLDSKAVNSSDAFALGMLAWIGSHAIVGVEGRHEIGHPGDVSANTADLNVTWYRWQRLYLTAGYRFGSVAYELLGGGVTLVDYDETDAYLVVNVLLPRGYGVVARYGHLENDLYHLDVARLALSKSW